MATDTLGIAVPDDGTRPISARVAADLSSDQYLAMTWSGDRTITRQASAGGTVCGILQDAPNGATTETVGSLKCSGFTYIISGGTCTVGGVGTVVVTTGRFVDATGSDVEAPVRFVEGTTTDGDRIIAQLIHAHRETP